MPTYDKRNMTFKQSGETLQESDSVDMILYYCLSMVLLENFYERKEMGTWINFTHLGY